MNILFLFVSLPNLEYSDSLFASLITSFHQHGHNVYVSAKGYQNDKTFLSVESDIPVLRIKSHNFTGVNHPVKKALAYQEYVVKQLYYTFKYFNKKKFDLIISHSLPPELAIIVSPLKFYFKSKFYLLQTDYTWQDAIAYGYFKKNSLVAIYYRFWEKMLFKIANYIACPTAGNISFIKKYYPSIEDSKFTLLPFWQNPITINTKYDLKEKYGLKSKFVVLYGGSVGIAQRVEHMVELAERCAEYKDIVFVVVGRGAYLPVIKNMVERKNLSNFIFIDFMPQHEYLSFLSSCDVGMIILNENMATPNFPSKSISYLNMKVPILAAVDYVTDFGRYLEENNAGLWAYSDNIDMLKEKLLCYYDSKELRDKVKESGYLLYINRMTPSSAYKTIIDSID